jgi:hypothetical protein
MRFGGIVFVPTYIYSLAQSRSATFRLEFDAAIAEIEIGIGAGLLRRLRE